MEASEDPKAALLEATAQLKHRIAALVDAAQKPHGDTHQARRQSRSRSPHGNLIECSQHLGAEADEDLEEAMVTAVESALAASKGTRSASSSEFCNGGPANAGAAPCLGAGCANGMPVMPPVANIMPMAAVMNSLCAFGGMGAMGGMLSVGGINPMAPMGGMGTASIAGMGLAGATMCPVAAASGGLGGAIGHLGPMANAAPTMGAVNPLAQFAAMGPMGGMALGMSPMSMAGHMNGMPGPMNGISSMGNLRSMACDGMQSLFKEHEGALARAMSESLRAGASEQGPDPSRADVPCGSSAASRESARSNVLSLAYRPPNAEPVFGITDRRFEGIIRSFNDQEGYGFLKCDSFDKVWAERGYSKNDVFVHRNQKGTFVQGDAVSFGVFLNFRGKPQATDLRPVSRGEWVGQNADEADGTGSRASSS